MEAMDVEKQIDMSLDDVIKQIGKARGARSSKPGRRRGRTGDKPAAAAEASSDSKRRWRGRRSGQRDKRGVLPGVSGGIKKNSGSQGGASGKVPLVVKSKGANSTPGGRAIAGIKVAGRRRSRKLSTKGGVRRMPAHLLPKKVDGDPARDSGSIRGAKQPQECTIVLPNDNTSKRAVHRTIAQAKAVLAKAEKVLEHKKAAAGRGVQPRKDKPKLQLPKRPTLPKPRDSSTAPTSDRSGGARGGARGPRLPLPRDRIVRLPSGAEMPSKMASDQPGRSALRPAGGVSKTKVKKQGHGSRMTLSERFSRVQTDRRDDGNRRRSNLVMP